MPFTSLSNKVEGNDDYRDINNQDIDMQAVKNAISCIFDNKNVMCMILKSDSKNRIAFVFDAIPGDPKQFEITFEKALRQFNIDFKSGWMEDCDDLVFILQL